MNVNLRPDLRDFVEKLVAAGEFRTTDAVINEAISALRDEREYMAGKAAAAANVNDPGPSQAERRDIQKLLREHRTGPKRL